MSPEPFIIPDGIPETPDAPPSAPERPTRTKKFQSLQARIYDFYMSPIVVMQPMAMMRAAAGDDHLYAAVNNYVAYVPVVADQWVTLAEQNTRVAEFLEKVLDGSVVGTLAVTHLTMLVPFLPPHILGRMFSFMPGARNGSNGNANGTTEL